jgi:surface carbohydrate biosynthesis protein
MPMKPSRRALIIPAEEQSREFDAKLLLACVAAERGFQAVVGSRREIHLKATRMPKGVYYAKSFRPLSRRMFEILRNLGYEIVACDEEALLRPPDDLYFERRVSPDTYGMISNLFAWGPENADLFRRCPGYNGAPIHVTGNPRIDLIRPELRAYFQADVEAIRRRYGDYLLINTNFGTVNHRVPNLSWLSFVELSEDGEDSADFKVAHTRHRLALFGRFKSVLPRIASAFPDLSIVIRPHPLEDHGPWRQAATGYPSVHVVHEGNAIPWLRGARAVIQNNCTTAIEAYVLERPVVSYRPVLSERLDSPLTNALSYQADDDDTLCDVLREIMDRELGVYDSPDQREIIEQNLAALDGPLASDRIVDVLEAMESSGSSRPPRSAFRHAHGWIQTHTRTVEKSFRTWIPGDKNNLGYQAQRFPGLSLEEVRTRVATFGELLGRFADLSVDQLSRNIFQIRAGSAS